MYEVMKSFMRAFSNNNEHVDLFVKILQLSIRSMNCFKLLLYEKPSYKTAPQFCNSGN